MTDVRLTATNPEDSSVVPVACNSRGELLITEVVVEEIDNDLTVDGNVYINCPATGVGGVDWAFGPDSGALRCFRTGHELITHNLGSGGLATHSRVRNDGPSKVEINSQNNGYAQYKDGNTANYRITWNGAVWTPEIKICLEQDNPVHFSPVRNVETGEETLEYIGPVLDVREELEFLRAQVRALMEKLKMTPEGGWPVWDGSTET